MVRQLRLSAPTAGDLGSIPGQGTRPCMLQQRPGLAKLKTKTKTKQQLPVILLASHNPFSCLFIFASQIYKGPALAICRFVLD